MLKNIHDSIKFTTEQHKLYVRQLKSEQTYFIKKLIQYDVLNLTLVTTNNVKTIYLFSLARQICTIVGNFGRTSKSIAFQKIASKFNSRSDSKMKKHFQRKLQGSKAKTDSDNLAFVTTSSPKRRKFFLDLKSLQFAATIIRNESSKTLNY